ncbi:hypothetical protein SAY86_028476 [Trapa natans]|uniref:Aquaporin n=1 Tax=Trapa natans TaxID=22666 RepID=A0AAN7MFI8_TRANT|nr:hypothetical protein SAY86_028476 [Trapa natans]
MVMQCLGAICGAGVVKGFEGRQLPMAIPRATLLVLRLLAHSCLSTLSSLPLMLRGVPVTPTSLYWLLFQIGFAVFLVHLATIPITGTSINPARSLGAAVIYNRDHAWDAMWIFWVGPFTGAALAAVYHQVVIRAMPFSRKSYV